MSQQFDRLISSLVADLQPVQRLTRRSGMAIALGALVVSISVTVFGIGLRPDVSTGQLDPVFLLSSGLFLLLAGASSFTVIELSRPQVGGHRDGWIWAVAMTFLLPASAALISAISWFRGTVPFVDPEGVKCLAMGIALGMIVGLPLVFWLRKGAAISPERAGLLTGLAAGSSGIFAFALHCPHSDIAHIGLWHGLAVAVSACFGRLVVPSLVRW